MVLEFWFFWILKAVPKTKNYNRGFGDFIINCNLSIYHTFKYELFFLYTQEIVLG